MWSRPRCLKDGTGSVRLGLLTFAISLAALVWLLTSGGPVQLRHAVAKAQLQWYAPRAIDVAQPSDLHGRVHKAGPIDLKLFYPPLREACDADRLGWTAAAGRDNLTQAELARLQLTPCAGCQVFVNHFYKIIYLRQPKVASSSILGYFGQCTADRHEETGCLRLWELPAAIPTSAARPTYIPLSNMSEAQVAELWADYFVFTATRNPFSRAATQYRTGLLSNLAEPAECAALAEGLDWDSFCDSPLSMLKFCARHPDCCLNGAAAGVRIKLMHLIPMAPCMTTPDGRLAADFVVRQELLEQDMEALLQHLNARQGAPELKLGPMKESRNVWPRCTSEQPPHHIVKAMQINQCDAGGAECIVAWQALEAKEQYCSIQEFYAGRHAHCKAGIATFYAEDLRLLYGGSDRVG